jgi:hypothetical protein
MIGRVFKGSESLVRHPDHSFKGSESLIRTDQRL